MNVIDRRLLSAAHASDEDDVKTCIEAGGNVNVTDLRGNTPLHYATLWSSEGCCRVLINSKARVNAVNKKGNTPLHNAVMRSSEGCCRVLINAKASVDAVNKKGNTPLHNAAMRSSEGCCTVLINAKASVDAVDEEGNTPLHNAAMRSSEGCCMVLINAKASINAVNKKGDTPFHVLCQWYNTGDLKCYNVIIALIHTGADITVKDARGNTPLEYLVSKSLKKRLEQEYEKYTPHRKLMAQGSRPVNVVKVFLCGDESAGKTTIKNTLTKKLSVMSVLRTALTGPKKKEEESGDYTMTPGIDVGKKAVRGVGQFHFWDCAGQPEYYITHGMFLGSGQSLFVVLYDIKQLAQGETPSTKYWLPFIKAVSVHDEKPKIILVGSHLDQIKDQRSAEHAARKLLHQAKEMFAGILDIDDAVILLDAREEDSEGMGLLKDALKRRRQEIVGTENIPKYCDKMLKMIKSWHGDEVPVISWSEYLKRVKQKYALFDDDRLRSVTAYLHMMGDVYLAKFAEKDDQLILNTQWFTSEIIGAAFAGEEFSNQLQTLPNQPDYTLQQLCEFFTDKMDTSQLLALLDHMDLVHETTDRKYLMPGKLPIDGPEVDWDAREVHDVKGISIECKADIDIINPNVFPCVQKVILDGHRGSTMVSRSAVKFAVGSIKVLVKLTKYKRSINVAAMCPDKDTREACYTTLQNVIDLIHLELLERSPGTNLRENYISHHSLRASKNLEDVGTYTKESLIKAEQEDGIIVLLSEPEEVTNILFQGYDKMFLQELGSQCRYEWLPIETVARCFGRLDRINDWGEDYRAVAKALGIPKHIASQLAEDSKRREESVTDNIIKKWCRDKKRKMTIGMLQKLLSRLSLVANEDALKAIDDMVERYKNKHCHRRTDDSTFEIGVSDHLARWRRVLKRKWSVLETDLDPNMLTSRLYYLPPKFCVIFEGTKSTDVQQRIKNAETLLLCLLQRDQEEWPTDLIAGLQETQQRPLAQTLEEEYKKVVREDESREERRMKLVQREHSLDCEVPADSQNNKEHPKQDSRESPNESNKDSTKHTRDEATGGLPIDNFKEVTGVDDTESASRYLRATDDDVHAAELLFFSGERKVAAAASWNPATGED